MQLEKIGLELRNGKTVFLPAKDFGFDTPRNDRLNEWQPAAIMPESLARYRLHVVNVEEVEKHPLTVDGLLVPNEKEGGLREAWYQTAQAWLERIAK